jgi:DNA-binding NarL/FixJ family response regulator
MNRSTRVRIVAHRPLLRAGLERLAASAHLTVVDTCEEADLVLRAADEPFDGAPVDVTLAGGAIVVTCQETPSNAVCDALGRIVSSALSG